MRLRNVSNAHQILLNSIYFIQEPEKSKGEISSFFPVLQPIHLEIGTGKGQFLIEMAKKYPEINFVGLEKYESVLVRAIEKCETLSLTNLKFMCFDAKEITNVFFHEIEQLYLNFSDPWPKNRHRERRLSSKTFLDLYELIFKTEKQITLKTDNIVLFASSLESLSQKGYIFKNVSLDLHQADIPNIETEYEEKFSKKGYKINYLKAMKP